MRVKGTVVLDTKQCASVPLKAFEKAETLHADVLGDIVLLRPGGGRVEGLSRLNDGNFTDGRHGRAVADLCDGDLDCLRCRRTGLVLECVLHAQLQCEPQLLIFFVAPLWAH